MPRLPVPLSAAAITEQLRAAGCVFAEDEAALLVAEATGSAALARMVEQRVSGVPLEHVVGAVTFCGHRIRLEPGVFVPRRRTERLARRAAGLLKQAVEDGVPGGGVPVVVDLCCGSGAVAVVLSTAAPRIRLHAVDIDPRSVRCAARNLRGTGARVRRGDLYTALPATLRGTVTILTANAPYVPTSEIELMPPEARLHEPRVALDGGPDGLDIHRRIILGAPGWLAPGGHLVVEVSERQAPALAAELTRSGLRRRIVRASRDGTTIVVATRPPRGR
jgi:release factor glutamine methyltransferase